MYGGESADTTSTSQTGITISCVSSYQERVIDTGGQVTGVSIFAKGTCRSKLVKLYISSIHRLDRDQCIAEH